MRGYLRDRQKLFTLGNVSGGYDSAMPDDTTITAGAVLTRTSERVVTITGLKAPDGYPVISLPTTQNIKINPVALANETAVTFTSAVCGTSTNDAKLTNVTTAAGQLVIPLVVKNATYTGTLSTDYKSALSSYFTFNGPNKDIFTSANITSAFLVAQDRIDVVFKTGYMPGDSSANIVVAEDGKLFPAGTPTLSVHATGHTNETNKTISGQDLNNDKLTITSVGGKFASQAILNRYWATAEGKKQLFTISPMSGLAGIDPDLAQASARIEVSASGLIITISGLAPIQGVLGSQTITINPIAFEDATNSSPTAITAVSGQSASSATAFLAPGSQGEIDVSGTSVTGLTSGKYIMKSGSAWYQLAAGTAAIPTTAVASLELAMTVTSTTTTGVTGLTTGVEYDIYRVMTPADGTDNAALKTKNLIVAGSDDATHTGIGANTIVYLTKLTSTNEVNITSAGNVDSAVKILFFTGKTGDVTGTADGMPPLSDSTNGWISAATLTNNLTTGKYYRMGSTHWLYRMKVITQGGAPVLEQNKADKFATLRNMNSVGLALNIQVTRGLILEEASRGLVGMDGTTNANAQSDTGRITITGLVNTSLYVVRETLGSSPGGWHPIEAGVVLNSNPDPTAGSFVSSGANSRKPDGTMLKGDSGFSWAPTPTWAVFQLLDISGISDTTVTLGGLDTVLNFTTLKYEGATPAVAKTGTTALGGAILNMSIAPTAAFDVAVNMGASNPIGAAIAVTNLTDAEYTPLNASTAALAFNDTKFAGTGLVSATQATTTTSWFTISIKAGTSASFTTTLVPAPETLAIVPTSTTVTNPTTNRTITLTATGPGKFITKTSVANVADIKFPKYETTPAFSLANLPSVPTRVTVPIAGTTFVMDWLGTTMPNFTGLVSSVTWGIDKSYLRRKMISVTGAASNSTP